MNLLLNTPLKSIAGNTYYKVRACNTNLYVTINPKWKQAQAEAIANKRPNKMPTFLLKAEVTKSEDYNGTGAAWSFLRKEGLVHQGNLQIDGTNFFVDIRKNADALTFTLTLTEKEELSLGDL